MTSQIPSMMPGQDPYTQEELDALYRWIAEASEDDPGEELEPEMLDEWGEAQRYGRGD